MTLTALRRWLCYETRRADLLITRETRLFTATRRGLPLFDALPDDFLAENARELRDLRQMIVAREIQRLRFRHLLMSVLESARCWKKDRPGSRAVDRFVRHYAPLLEENHRISDALAAEDAINARRSRT